MLSVSEKTIYRRMEDYGLQFRRFTKTIVIRKERDSLSFQALGGCCLLN